MSYIAILETGIPPKPLDEAYGTYADMFTQTLAAPERQFKVFRTFEGELPEITEPFIGVLITGSPAGVYEDTQWIKDLKAWLQALPQDVPVVGICFGHQIMAQAWGGHVEKSTKGWGVGVHEYNIQDAEFAKNIFEADLSSLRVAVTHQDQVVTKPATAKVLAGSDFTPYGALYYTDRKAISFQCHPEFNETFACDLLISRRGTRIAEALVDQAIETFKAPNSRHQVMTAISRFLGP
jgi:GMP synthase-like glutamine amidotransferase